MAQVERNTLTVDGNSYEFDTDVENAITLKKDRYDNWNLLAFVKIDGKNVAFAIVTPKEKLDSGFYSLMNRVKRVDNDKVAFSVNIINEKDGGMAALTMKQFTSLENGKAEIKNDNGVYAITITNVEVINMKGKKFMLSGNITLDPNELKTRKERNEENDNLNMREAFLNEFSYCKMQDEKLEKTYNKYQSNLTQEVKSKLYKSQDNITASFKEMLKILNRKNDGSVTTEQIGKAKEIVTKKLNELKQIKAEDLREYLNEYREKTWIF